MRRPLGGLGMAAVLAHTIALYGMAGIEPPERSITPRDPWVDEPKPLKRDTETGSVKSGDRYDKAEAKRQRKAAKRMKDAGHE